MAFRLNRLRDFYHVLTKVITKNANAKLDLVDSVLLDRKNMNNALENNFTKKT